MYTVGRFIGRGFSTVSGPFHPFGGAVDIVVVEQPDGSFKSSPWYVQFGKFQGVLKSREKVVSICVNDVEAGFHMYLDHTGEAYFLEEVDEEITVDFSSSGESKGKLTKSLSYNLDAEGSLLARSETVASESSASSVTGSKRSRLLGLVWGRKLSPDEFSPEISRATSLDRAEIVADLLDVNWSTELATEKSKPYISSQLSECIVSSDECTIDGDSLPETNLASSSAAGPFVQEPSGLISEVSQNFVDLQIGDERNNENGSETFHINSAETLLESNSLQELTTDSTEESLETRQSLQSNGLVPQCVVKLMTPNKSYYSLQNTRGSSTSVDDTMDCVRTGIGEESSSSLLVEDVGFKNCHRTSGLNDTVYRSELGQSINAESHEDEQFIFSDDELKPDDDQKTSVSTSLSVDKELDTLTTTDDPRLRSHVSLASTETGHQVDAEKKFEDLLEKEQQKTFFPIDINEFHDASTDIDERMVESLPNLWSHIDSLEAEHRPRRSFDASTTSPRWLNLQSNISSFKIPAGDIETDLDKSQVTVTDDAPPEALKSDSVSSGVGDPSKTIVVPTGTWRLWPFSFQRAPSSKSTTSSTNISTVADMNRSTKSISLITDTKPEVQHKVIKKKMRTITPTSVQIASLGLKEGGNIITFTFSTAMLGKQQVDGRIYLWKWNDRVVISDVDGTITRSDVLGQFMPMVGYDWSHIGVAHLFSAIKENGYQLLFLSARSISQSHLTRQFLFNLKQDGKALPDGPVVISPDGLFPSLFREVIRRAPHEFKIACLEDIKALFPCDRNPFYAGFGNRDTDEISYLRVGIPEGKIFIINPKGEVAVHRRVDTNSYSDLHSLVNGMFPVFSSSEQQEAFNSWNFWKLPPRMDFEI